MCLLTALLAVGNATASSGAPQQIDPAASLEKLELHNVEAKSVQYQGRRALRVVQSDTPNSAGHAIVTLPESNFQNGVIEVEIAGLPREGAPEGSRGFVGIAFRVKDSGDAFECFYLRPTNGRADDQLRRNHSTQYISHPDYPWHLLRTESPGVYESYTDLVPGAWIRVRIVVEGKRAGLYVNGAEQPCLIVNDLKLGDGEGAVALWIGSGTEAFFSGVRITRAQ